MNKPVMKKEMAIVATMKKARMIDVSATIDAATDMERAMSNSPQQQPTPRPHLPMFTDADEIRRWPCPDCEAFWVVYKVSWLKNWSPVAKHCVLAYDENGDLILEKDSESDCIPF